MEFPFNINLDLPSEVSVLNSTKNYLQIQSINVFVAREPNTVQCTCIDFVKTTDKQSWKLLQERLSLYVDVMGQKSAEAQGLKEPITSAEKLIRSDHRLYMIKDSSANNGKGALVGILKVGVKKLFLPDSSGDLVEVNPVCLLDIYVVESRQRQGYGLCLFKVMLEIEAITPLQLAIDKPSKLLLCFLKKHYHLDNPEFHANKYVVFPGFLRSVTGNSIDPLCVEQDTSDQEKSQQAVILNRSEALKDSPSPSIVHPDVLHAPPPTSTVKNTPGVVTPTRFNSERRWQQMYDTWNVVGVPPRDYSYIKNMGSPPVQSEIGKTIMPQPVKQNHSVL